MPAYIPLHTELVYLSGIVEIVLGVLVAIPRTAVFGGVGHHPMLIAFLPVHVHMLVNNHLYPEAPTSVLWLRFPIQALVHPVGVLVHRSRPLRALDHGDGSRCLRPRRLRDRLVVSYPAIAPSSTYCDHSAARRSSRARNASADAAGEPREWIARHPFAHLRRRLGEVHLHRGVDLALQVERLEDVGHVVAHLAIALRGEAGGLRRHQARSSPPTAACTALPRSCRCGRGIGSRSRCAHQIDLLREAAFERVELFGGEAGGREGTCLLRLGLDLLGGRGLALLGCRRLPAQRADTPRRRLR